MKQTYAYFKYKDKTIRMDVPYTQEDLIMTVVTSFNHLDEINVNDIVKISEDEYNGITDVVSLEHEEIFDEPIDVPEAMLYDLDEPFDYRFDESDEDPIQPITFI